MIGPLASCLGGRGEHDWVTSELPGREGGGSMIEPLASCLRGRGENDWATSKLPGRERGE